MLIRAFFALCKNRMQQKLNLFIISIQIFANFKFSLNRKFGEFAKFDSHEIMFIYSILWDQTLLSRVWYQSLIFRKFLMKYSLYSQNVAYIIPELVPFVSNVQELDLFTYATVLFKGRMLNSNFTCRIYIRVSPDSIIYFESLKNESHVQIRTFI